MTAPRGLNAVDMSRWGGELTAGEARALLASGIRLVIVGTGDSHPGGAGEWARQQAQAWLGSGGETVDAYIYLVFAADPAAQVRQALASLSGLPIRRWWLDAEDVASPALRPAEREAFLDACLGALAEAGAQRGIYSGRWWWVPNMANSTRFAALPLWNSYYDSSPDESGLPYGGWEHSAIEQYQGTTVLCGQSVDLNYAADLDPAEENEMADEDDLLLALFAGSEQHDPEGAVLPREARIAYARSRLSEVVAGTAPSLVELAAEALAFARAVPAGGSVRPHRHGLVASTGEAQEISA